MKKLFINCFIFSFPILVAMLFFVIDDPFGVWYKNKCLAEPSEDVLTTRDYLTHFNEKKSNSFIFGNSRAEAFLSADWQKVTPCGTVFNFASPGESVLNIRKKIELILSHQKMDNALIIIDAGILQNTDNTHRFYQGPVYNHSPVTSNISYLDFYANYIKYYFSDYFFLKHMYYTLSGNYVEAWMANSFKNPAMAGSQDIKSHKYARLADSLIETDFAAYKKKFKPDYSRFVKSIKTVSKTDSLHLLAMCGLLTENNVDYRIVIPPDFHKEKVPPGIYKTLSNVAGKRLYDFTGINRITTDSTLNYENLHFTRRAGFMILDSIYKN